MSRPVELQVSQQDPVQAQKSKQIISQILFDACDKCETLLKIQSLLNDPKYNSNGKTAASTVAP